MVLIIRKEKHTEKSSFCPIYLCLSLASELLPESGQNKDENHTREHVWCYIANMGHMLMTLLVSIADYCDLHCCQHTCFLSLVESSYENLFDIQTRECSNHSQLYRLKITFLSLTKIYEDRNSNFLL